jgi:hypothetical protein
MDQKLDGNAAGGILREIFPFEMTNAEGVCGACGGTAPIGALVAYIHGMGAILRWPGCDNVLIRISHTRGRYWLDMRGVRILRIQEQQGMA